MKALNEMKLQIPSRSVNEGFARLAVAGFVAQLDPTISEITDIKTAVSEAVTNCIVHAYPGRVGAILITARILPGGVVHIEVKDRGCGIPDIRQAMEPLFTTAGGERAGLGFAVMESFMDTIRVLSKPGRGTTVKLTKKITCVEDRACDSSVPKIGIISGAELMEKNV